MRTFESEPMQIGMPRVRTRSAGRNPSPRSASVVGQAQIVAPWDATRSSSAPSACVACTTVVRSVEAAGPREQLDRPAPVLGEALLDLLRLLVGVDVQREARRASGVSADLLQPVRGTRTDGVRCEPDNDPVGAQLLDLARDIPQPIPAGSGGVLRARTRRGGGRTRRRLRSRPRRRRAPRTRPGSGTPRRPCSRQPASRGSRARTPRARALASAAPPPRA